MLRTLSWNVNGIRACARQGFVDLLNKSEADIVGLQEVRASKEQIPSEILENKNCFKLVNFSRTEYLNFQYKKPHEFFNYFWNIYEKFKKTYKQEKNKL